MWLLFHVLQREIFNHKMLWFLNQHEHGEKECIVRNTMLEKIMIRLHSMSASISFILSPDEFNVPFYTFIRQCLVNIMWRPLNGYVGCGVWVLCAQKRYHLPEKLTRLEDFSEYFSANSLEARRCLDALVERATTERYAPNCSKMLYVVKSKVESHTHTLFAFDMRMVFVYTRRA